MLSKIKEVANALTPKAPELKYQRLFGNRDYNLFEETGNYDEQHTLLEGARLEAVRTILASGGLQAIVKFAHNVASPFQVGRALGNIDDKKLETDILPTLLEATEDTEKKIVEGYIVLRHWRYKWAWADELLDSDWTKEQKVKFLMLLPFGMEVWHRVSSHLDQKYERDYWRNVEVYPYSVSGDLTVAIEKLLECQRPASAVLCVHETTRHGGGRFDEGLATRTLRALLETPSDIKHLERHEIVRKTVDVIKHLQESPSLHENTLFEIEWSFLPWLGTFSEGSPITLQNRLASDPAFFAEVVRLVFRSNKDNRDDRKLDKHRRNLARNAYTLLTEWKRCPGTKADGSFDAQAFKLWLGKARRITEETGHGEVAQSQIGHVFTHAPKDPNGLWIHEVVAEALNRKGTGVMRSGFTRELFNQRGVHSYTAGREELELAQRYRDKANELENGGFSRFATAMREFARDYERDAEREARRRLYGE